MNTTMTKVALALALTMGATAAHAVAVNTGDTLTIRTATLDGSGYVLATGGSYFGMDTNGKGGITANERVGMSQGTNGIVIGATTTAGAFHPGVPLASDTGAVVDSWAFFGSTGTNFNTVGITGSTTAGLNFSGWNVAWNAVSAINMGSGAWGTGFVSGVANFSWDGVYGSTYTLDYHATVPAGDPSGFQFVPYALHLEGTVLAAAPVPEASTYGMMLAGLGLVGFAVRRRKSNI